jgi:hypothetical protein
MARKKSSYELRCFCAHEPLLGTYGRNERGELYIHVRVYKQDRIYGEVVVTSGRVQIHCRDCLRWHRVVIRSYEDVELKEELVPPQIPARL